MKRNYLLPLFLLFQIIFLKIVAYFPERVEQFYSNGLYLIIASFSRTIFGKIPFSVGDLLYLILIIYSLFCIYKYRTSSWKTKVLSVLSFLSVFYFLFHLLWALNYYRQPLFEKMQISKEYSDEKLYDFTEKLIAKSNDIQYQITKNKTVKVENKASQNDIFTSSQNGYNNLSLQYPYLKYQIPSQKKSLFSLLLTYMGFSGYLNPFTNEAQVNSKIPMYDFPFVICHEMAHQIGYGSESECNFIGFLACKKSSDLYFQYSAYVVALHYCMENIALKDESKFKFLKSKINLGILENYKQSEVFWKQYDTFIDKGFHTFYDQFLKINQQKDGIESYSKFVDLLLNYYCNKNL